MTNKPMKGCHVMINEKLIEFLQDTLGDLIPPVLGGRQPAAYSDDLCDRAPETVLSKLEDKGWTIENDKFGRKAYRAIQFPASTPPLPTDEFRVSVVLQKGVLKLDIRPWGQYELHGAPAKRQRAAIGSRLTPQGKTTSTRAMDDLHTAGVDTNSRDYDPGPSARARSQYLGRLLLHEEST